MKPSVLITDSLFVFEEHEELIKSKGYSIIRIDKPCASEDELIEGLKSSVGYILGGVERVTSRVIQSAPTLKVISFTGSGYDEFIPCHEEATKQGIAIAATRGANSFSVAEYAVALILNMMRQIPVLTDKEGKKFLTTQSAKAQTIGIIGFGSIGRRVAEICKCLGFDILVQKHNSLPDIVGQYQVVEKQDLIARSDIITVHVNKRHGHNALSESDIQKLKNNTVVINTAFPEAVDQKALVKKLKEGTLRAAFDAPLSIDIDPLPIGQLIQSNSQTAFNTVSANKIVSDVAVGSLLNLLDGQDSINLVNKEYINYRKS